VISSCGAVAALENQVVDDDSVLGEKQASWRSCVTIRSGVLPVRESSAVSSRSVAADLLVPSAAGRSSGAQATKAALADCQLEEACNPRRSLLSCDTAITYGSNRPSSETLATAAARPTVAKSGSPSWVESSPMVTFRNSAGRCQRCDQGVR